MLSNIIFVIKTVKCEFSMAASQFRETASSFEPELLTGSKYLTPTKNDASMESVGSPTSQKGQEAEESDDQQRMGQFPKRNER